jgi:NFU1 iron-sulfur cluster scaffold homolog, mitochondrial
MTTTTAPIDIYTEMTPNPATMKFVLNKMLLPNRIAEFGDIAAATKSPMATELFGFPYVKSVFIMNNFVTITKQADVEWEDVIPTLKEFVKKYVQEDGLVVSDDFSESNNNRSINENETEKKIKDVLENYVKPAVEMDGGFIQFKSYHEGKVALTLQGSCSGCPSSMITLKAGIEGLLKRLVPEVKEVEAEAK